MPLIIVIILLVAFVIIYFYSRKEDTSTELSQSIPVVTPPLQEHIINHNTILPNDGDLFKDHLGEGYTLFSDLTPEQAEHEMVSRRASGEWLSKEDWIGYKEIVSSANDAQFSSEIKTMTPEETFNWFTQNYEAKTGMSVAIWKQVRDKVAPMQEADLLLQLDGIKPGRVEGWLRARKEEHYFISPAVYQVAKLKRDKHFTRTKN